MSQDQWRSNSIVTDVCYADAETRGRIRAWKRKLARDAATIDDALRQLTTTKLVHDMVDAATSGRQRAFAKICKLLGPGAVLSEKHLERRHAVALWSYLKPRSSVTVTATVPSDTPEAVLASLAQSCVTVNYIVVGTRHRLVADGLWTLEVPDHALGRAVERSRLLHPETIIRDAHRELLQLPYSTLSETKMAAGATVYIKAGAGCFTSIFRLGSDVSASGSGHASVRVTTWLSDDQLHEDQIVLSKRGEPGNRLGDSWLMPRPFRRIERLGAGEYVVSVGDFPLPSAVNHEGKEV